MEENNNIVADTAVAESVTPETTAEVTPSESQETNIEVKETTEAKAPEQEKKPFVEGLTYETPDDLVKGVKEKDSTISKLSQELAEIKKAQEAKQYEQQKTQVETGDTQLKQEYNALVYNMKQEKANLTAQALAEYNETGDVNKYNGYLMQLDAWYEEAKGNLDGNYKHAETELQKQRRELSEQTNQRAIATFKETEKEFCEKHSKVIDKYLELGYDPQDLSAVKELLNIALAERDNFADLSSINDEAKKKLVSATSTPSGEFGGDHVFTRSEIAEMQKTPQGRANFLKNETKIMAQMSKGLIN